MLNIKNEPFVSIVIVSYNYEKFILRTLNACKRQTFKNFEIVLIDNGSTDNTEEIILEFIKENNTLDINHIKIEVNDGLAKGRNRGIKEAKGKYILFNDADDWMDDDCLEVLVKVAKDTNADRVVGDYRHIDEEGMRILYNLCYSEDNVKWYTTMLQGSLFRTSIFLDNNIEVPQLFVDDVYIALNFAYYAKNFQYSHQIKYNVFRHKTSMTGLNSIKGLEKAEKIYNDVYNIFFDIYLKSDAEDDKVFLEYFCIKTYYHYLLNFGRGAKRKQLMRSYKIAKSRLSDQFPYYLKNKNIGFFRSKDNAHGKIIITVCTFFEKTHLFKPVLITYGFISKFIEFKEKI